MATCLALVFSTAFGAGFAAAANPNRTFDVTACTTPNGKDLILTASWSGMHVDAWSWFVESADGSGGVFGPVPQPGDSGTVTDTFPAETTQSVNATVFRAAGPHYVEVGSVTLPQPVDGWARC